MPSLIQKPSPKTMDRLIFLILMISLNWILKSLELGPSVDKSVTASPCSMASSTGLWRSEPSISPLDFPLGVDFVEDANEEDEEMADTVLLLGVRETGSGLMSVDFKLEALLLNPFNGSKQIQSLWTTRLPGTFPFKKANVLGDIEGILLSGRFRESDTSDWCWSLGYIFFAKLTTPLLPCATFWVHRFQVSDSGRLRTADTTELSDDMILARLRWVEAVFELSSTEFSRFRSAKEEADLLFLCKKIEG